MSVIDYKKWRLSIIGRFTASGGTFKELPCGVHVHALTSTVDERTRKPELDGGSADYLLTDFDGLSEPSIHDVFKGLPEGTRAIVALGPEPDEEVYRTRKIPMDEKMAGVSYIKGQSTAFIIPTAPSTLFSLPMPFYLDWGICIARIDSRDGDKLIGLGGRHFHLKGYQIGEMGIQTEINTEKEKGICSSCFFGVDFCQKHIVSPIAGKV